MAKSMALPDEDDDIVIEGSLEQFTTGSTTPSAARKPKDVKNYVKSAPLEDFAPDPDQPAKHGPRMSPESLGKLGNSLEKQGLQTPLIVRKNVYPDIAARFLIKDGERRWRGACLNGNITTLDYIEESTEESALDLLKDQITVNNEREAPIQVDNADAYKRCVDLIKNDNPKAKQKDIATELNLPEADLSRYISLAGSNDVIRELSFDNFVQDLITLSHLKTLREKDKTGEIFAQVIKKIRAEEIDGSVRSFVKKTLDDLKAGVQKPPAKPKEKPIKLQTVKELKLLSTSPETGNKQIAVTVGKKELHLEFTQEQLLELID